MAFVSDTEEIKALNQAISSFDASIKILQKTLNERKSGDEFFATLKAVTTSHPSKEDRNALKKFLDDNDHTLRELSLSTEYFEYIDNYMNKRPTAVTPLEEGPETNRGCRQILCHLQGHHRLHLPIIQTRRP